MLLHLGLAERIGQATSFGLRLFECRLLLSQLLFQFFLLRIARGEVFLQAFEASLQFAQADLELQLLSLRAGEGFTAVKFNLGGEFLLPRSQLLRDVPPLLLRIAGLVGNGLLLASEFLAAPLQFELFAQLAGLLFFAGRDALCQLLFGLGQREPLLLELVDLQFQLRLLVTQNLFALDEGLLLIGELPGLLGELGLPVVMIERAGLQIGGKALLIGDRLNLCLFEFLPLPGQLLLIGMQLLAGHSQFGLRGVLQFAVAGQLIVLLRVFAELAGDQIQALVELRFELLDPAPLFVQSLLRLGATLFQPQRKARVPLIGGGGDFQSVVVHGYCALLTVGAARVAPQPKCAARR